MLPSEEAAASLFSPHPPLTSVCGELLCETLDGTVAASEP